MITRLVISIFFIYFHKCNAMSSAEAVLRCRTSIESAGKASEQLWNRDLKKVAQVALSLMQKNLEELLHSNSMKDIPSITQQCMQHAEHVNWLKNSIDPEIKTKTSETVVANSLAPFPSELKIKSSKKSGKKSKEKKIIIDQKNFDSKILKKILRSKNLEASAEKSAL